MNFISTNTLKTRFIWKIPIICVIGFFLNIVTVSAEDVEEYIHYRLGVKYKNDKKYDEAIEEFRKVLAEYPESYNAYMHMAEIRVAQNRSRLVIYNLKKALTYNPGWGKAHKMLAATYQKDGQIQKAIIELQQYLQSSDPAERDSLQNQIEHLIGLVNTNDNSVKETDSTQNSGVEINPASAIDKQRSNSAQNSTIKKESAADSGQIEQVFRKALQLYNDSNYNAAMNKFREVITLDSKHSGGYYYAGLIRFKLGQSKMAKINFKKALSYPEQNYSAYYYLGKISADEQNYSDAVSYLSSYVSSTSYEPGKKEALGLIEKYKTYSAATKSVKQEGSALGQKAATVVGNEKEATFSVEKPVAQQNYVSLEIRIDSTLSMLAIDTLTDAGQKLLGGIREFSAGNFDKAIIEFKKVLATNPGGNTAAACIFNTGICYLKMNLFKDAENQFQQIIDRYPSHPSAAKSQFLKAVTYQQRSEPIIAEKLFRQFLQDFRTHIWAPEAFERLGDCYCDLEQYKKAVDAYTQALKVNNITEKMQIHFKAGIAFLRLENERRAIENYFSVIELGEKNGIYLYVPDCYYRIADIHYKSKEYQKALALYKKVTRKFPAFQETPWGLFQIGSIYKNLKQYQDAVDMFKDLIRRYPDDYWAKQAQWKLEDSIWENEYKTVLN